MRRQLDECAPGRTSHEQLRHERCRLQNPHPDRTEFGRGYDGHWRVAACAAPERGTTKDRWGAPEVHRLPTVHADLDHSGGWKRRRHPTAGAELAVSGLVGIQASNFFAGGLSPSNAMAI